MPLLPLTQLEATLGYVFDEPSLLAQALRHRSVSRHHNERLEFLGDSVLNLCVTEAVYRLKPECDEGELTRIRASLINRDSLAELATEIGLIDHIRIAAQERRNGTKRRISVRADTLEALFGAVYLDGGMEAARDLVSRLYARHLSDLPDPDSLKDPKTRLQERMQKRGEELPVYTIIAETGKGHEKHFEVRCEITGARPTEGGGTTRRKAEQAAAEQMLQGVGDA